MILIERCVVYMRDTTYRVVRQAWALKSSGLER